MVVPCHELVGQCELVAEPLVAAVAEREAQDDGDPVERSEAEVLLVPPVKLPLAPDDALALALLCSDELGQSLELGDGPGLEEAALLIDALPD